MPFFRKKPVVIEAQVFEWGLEDGLKFGNSVIPKDASRWPESQRSEKFPGYHVGYERDVEDRGFDSGNWRPYIETLEGKMLISEGDYIITGVKSERYPCKPDIFEASYEAVE